ncbi:MAG TPA: SRPBCC family protein [Phototrophicaceae bacterium]|nr:SRPBCC family protein [Phototrophicaceae bacterium]
MAKIEQSIDVQVPVRTAYNQWTQFEAFPMFMEGVKEVQQLSDNRLLWRAEIAGKDEEWFAEISEQLPDQRIAWHSTSGAKNAGVVTFHYLHPNTTRVTLQIEYDPEGPIENVGNLLGFVSRRVQGDLERFKEFIEGRGTATGAWRGAIEQENVQNPGWRAQSDEPTSVPTHRSSASLEEDEP